ncbi:hypothetical protein [Roseimarinus sediminis]|uniref:hypothetical protein n=1 Tax=Roseimarinus sediminis TaxID=1610899 RepID=UPI003D1EAC87
MIRCLIVGQQEDIDRYLPIVSGISYFSKVNSLLLTDSVPDNYRQVLVANDALMLISAVSDVDWLILPIKLQCKVLLCDQPHLSLTDLSKLFQLHTESRNIMYLQINELHHPLIEDFIETTGHHLLFRYTRSINSKKDVRSALVNALSLLTLMSPLQVKKIDISSISPDKKGRPAYKIRLKMYDSSLAYIVLKLNAQSEHSIIIESKNGNFTFNFTQNYIENIHGTRFEGEKTNDSQLISKAINSFALCIIMNEHPRFTFFHYSLVFQLLNKFENILLQSI